VSRINDSADPQVAVGMCVSDRWDAARFMNQPVVPTPMSLGVRPLRHVILSEGDRTLLCIVRSNDGSKMVH